MVVSSSSLPGMAWAHLAPMVSQAVLEWLPSTSGTLIGIDQVFSGLTVCALLNLREAHKIF